MTNVHYRTPGIGTLLAHAQATRQSGGPTQRSPEFSTTYLRRDDGSFYDNRIYGRDDNPTVGDLERVLAEVEGGFDCFAFSSGMAAISAILSSLPHGTAVLHAPSLYYGVESWLAHESARLGLHPRSVDLCNAGKVDQALRAHPGVKAIWIETPGNPFLDIIDIAACAALARDHDAIVIVDSSLATPCLTNPLQLGADLVVHSATKYLGGHSDLLGGLVVCRGDSAQWRSIRDHRYYHGSQLAPFDSWLLGRSLQTLDVRMTRICATAKRLAEYLDTQAAVSKVYHPSLPAHPGHAIAVRQLRGRFGGVMSFVLKGSEAQAIAFTNALKLVKRATSFGGCQSSIEHHASIRDMYDARTAVPRTLLRFSTGLEDYDDLVDDITQALAIAQRS